MASFNFTPTPTAPTADPSAGLGMQQYLSQGAAQINPGQSSVAASNPISAAGLADLAKVLQSQQQPQTPDQPQLPSGVSQTALGMGANMAPNSPSGENMGGVGPTPGNLALAQGLQNMPGQQSGQNPFQMLGGWFGGGGNGN